MSATVTILGNSATQTAKYETTAFLLATESTSILVDCGPGIIRQLLRSNIKLDAIDTVVITHSHADHSGGYSYLLFLAAYELLQRQETRTLHVIALEEVHEALAQISALHYPRPIPNLQIDALVAQSSGTSTFENSGVRTTTVPVSHAVPNIGLRIETDSGMLAYSSDTVYSDAFVSLASSADLLLHEAFCTSADYQLASRTRHATAADAGAAARAAGASRLLLTHPLPQYRLNTDALIDEAAASYPGPISVPVELDVITMGGY